MQPTLAHTEHHPHTTPWINIHEECFLPVCTHTDTVIKIDSYVSVNSMAVFTSFGKSTYSPMHLF